MAPVKVYHSAYQGEIGFLLRSLRNDGKVLRNVQFHCQRYKSCHVAWASEARFQRIKDETECSIAPEICVEVLSLSNTDDEIEEKRALYFDRGAQEVWICKADGDIHFYTAAGRIEQSILVPGFPQHVTI